eukprot:717837-Pyramimonas_sp.AAC.1
MAMRSHPAVINLDVNIGGRHTDGVTYIMFLLSTKFETWKRNANSNREQLSSTFASMRKTDRPDVSMLEDIIARADIRTQQQSDAVLERVRSCAHIAERTPANIGGIFSHGHRADAFHADTHAGQPANNVWNDDPQPTEATTLDLANRVASLRGRKTPGPSATAAPTQASALVGSVGHPAESEFDSDTGTDAASDEGNGNQDYSDMPVYLTEDQQ